MINLNIVISIIVFVILGGMMLNSLYNCNMTVLDNKATAVVFIIGSLMISVMIWAVLSSMAPDVLPNISKIEKYAPVNSVIYDVSNGGTTKFRYRKNKTDETYQYLRVWFEEDTDEPYLAYITFTNKSNNLKFTGRYLVLDESYRDYGLNVIFSENNTEELKTTPMASIIYTEN